MAAKRPYEEMDNEEFAQEAKRVTIDKYSASIDEKIREIAIEITTDWRKKIMKASKKTWHYVNIRECEDYGHFEHIQTGGSRYVSFAGLCGIDSVGHYYVKKNLIEYIREIVNPVEVIYERDGIKLKWAPGSTM